MTRYWSLPAARKRRQYTRPTAAFHAAAVILSTRRVDSVGEEAGAHSNAAASESTSTLTPYLLRLRLRTITTKGFLIPITSITSKSIQRTRV